MIAMHILITMHTAKLVLESDFRNLLLCSKCSVSASTPMQLWRDSTSCSRALILDLGFDTRTMQEMRKRKRIKGDC